MIKGMGCGERSLRVGVLAATLALLAGCAIDHPVHERAWIGGTYGNLYTWYSPPGHGLPRPLTADSMPKEITAGHDQAVLVQAVYEGTPAAAAGLEPGDVILAVGGADVNSVNDLWDSLDAVAPGESLDLEVSRFGKVETLSVTLGTERYQRVGFFSIFLGVSTRLVLDWWPAPTFDLLGLMSFTRVDDRLELRSPRMRVRDWVARDGEEDTAPEEPAADTVAVREIDESGVTSHEGWRFNLLIFGVSKRNHILSQEL